MQPRRQHRRAVADRRVRQRIGDFRLGLFATSLAIAAGNDVFDRFDFEVRGDVFDDAFARRGPFGENAAATRAGRQFVNDDAVDAFGCRATVAGVAGLCAGRLFAMFTGRLGVGRQRARRRVRPDGRTRPHRHGRGHREQEKEDLHRIAMREFGRLRLGERPGTKRVEKRRIEIEGRSERCGHHGKNVL